MSNPSKGRATKQKKHPKIGVHRATEGIRFGEDSHTLRLKSELFDLRVGNANLQR